MTFAELADFLKRSSAEVRPAMLETMDVEMKVAAETAKAFIGNEQVGWAPLAESTIADKARKGYATPKPLERTGALKESIAGHVVYTPEGVTGAITATDPNALTHEYGSSREPPRPFMGPAVMLAAEPIHAALGKVALKLLVPGFR